MRKGEVTLEEISNRLVAVEVKFEDLKDNTETITGEIYAKTHDIYGFRERLEKLEAKAGTVNCFKQKEKP